LELEAKNQKLEKELKGIRGDTSGIGVEEVDSKIGKSVGIIENRIKTLQQQNLSLRQENEIIRRELSNIQNMHKQCNFFESSFSQTEA
jgi:hypothetical protein